MSDAPPRAFARFLDGSPFMLAVAAVAVLPLLIAVWCGWDHPEDRT